VVDEEISCVEDLIELTKSIGLFLCKCFLTSLMPEVPHLRQLSKHFSFSKVCLVALY
jgi:hypothetical protein